MNPAQIGGRILGQGEYGCTFEPVPRCAGGKVFNQISGLPAVGKVTPDDVTAELSIGQTIMALPLATQYFALPTETCRPTEPISDPDADKCKLLAVESHRDLTTLIMPAAGQQLFKYGADLVRLATTYKRIFIHLLEGATIYQDAGYVHNDIHQGNVLVDSAGVARFIDFGMAFRPRDITTWRSANLGMRFRPAYHWQPPEIHAWRMRFNLISLESGVAQLKAITPEYRYIETQFPRRKTMVHALEDMFDTAPQNSLAFIKQYGKLLDAWRIGYGMWILWQHLISWPGFKKTGLYNDYERIREVLGGLTEFNPVIRLTIRQALARLDPNNRMASSPEID